MKHETHGRLGAQQASIIRALVAGADIPPPFDGRRMAACAEVLARKRARELLSSWPGLKAHCAEHFAAFSRQTSYPLYGGPLADGWAFSEFLRQQLCLAPAVELQRAKVMARWKQTPEGLLERRHLHLVFRKLPGLRRAVGVLHIPGRPLFVQCFYWPTP